MKFYFPKTPSIFIRTYSKYTWRFLSQKKEIFLTFDDGPTLEITQFVLDELKKHQAKATFFCIGKNVQNHPEIFQRVLENGHSIGNHTQNHLNGWKHAKEEYLKDFLECKHILKEHVNSEFKNQNLKLFRPPYGKIKKSQAKVLLKKGYKIIMWDVLSADFDKKTSKEICLDNVLNNAKNGSIIVFHDSVKASEKVRFVLPKVLEYYSKKGFIFKAIK